MKKINKKIKDRTDKWMLSNVVNAWDNPILFIFVMGLNLFFWFDQFGSNYSIVFLYFIGLISLLLIQLIKFKIIPLNELAQSKSRVNDIILYLIILLMIYGAVSIIVLTVIGTMLELMILIELIMDFRSIA